MIFNTSNNSDAILFIEQTLSSEQKQQARENIGVLDIFNESNIIQTSNISDKAITRDKLADDALYSPIRAVTSPTYSFTADDAGYTVRTEFTESVATYDFVFTLDQDVSAQLPVGTEIAVMFAYGRSVAVTATNGTRFGIMGDSDWRKNATIKLSDRFTMLAAKKIMNASSTTGGDTWLITGPVEVVT